MEEFLRRKRTVAEAGSWKENDFIKLEELGFGNGGMVLKVKHRETGIVMARKVRPHHPSVRLCGPVCPFRVLRRDLPHTKLLISYSADTSLQWLVHFSLTHAGMCTPHTRPLYSPCPHMDMG